MTLVFVVVGICAILPAILLIMHLRERNKPMATIHERLAALEAAQTAGSDAAKAADLTALTERVTKIEGDLGEETVDPATIHDPADPFSAPTKSDSITTVGDLNPNA